MEETMSKREYMTEEYYPDKITVEKFVQIITNEELLRNFVTNMNNLDQIPQERYPEEWIKTFAAWAEMN
jgi:hypothetical protein